MKRIAVALVSCSLLTLGACGGDDEDRPARAQTSAAKPVRIVAINGMRSKKLVKNIIIENAASAENTAVDNSSLSRVASNFRRARSTRQIG